MTVATIAAVTTCSAVPPPNPTLGRYGIWARATDAPDRNAPRVRTQQILMMKVFIRGVLYTAREIPLQAGFLRSRRPHITLARAEPNASTACGFASVDLYFRRQPRDA